MFLPSLRRHHARIHLARASREHLPQRRCLCAFVPTQRNEHALKRASRKRLMHRRYLCAFFQSQSPACTQASLPRAPAAPQVPLRLFSVAKPACTRASLPRAPAHRKCLCAFFQSQSPHAPVRASRERLPAWQMLSCRARRGRGAVGALRSTPCAARRRPAPCPSTAPTSPQTASLPAPFRRATVR